MCKTVWGKLAVAIVILIASVLVVTGCSQGKTSQPATSSSSDKRSSSNQAQDSKPETVEKEIAKAPVKLEKVVVGYPSITMTWFPIKVAAEKGFFKDEGLDLNMVQMKGNVAIAALSQGDADYVTHLGSTMRAAISQNVPLRAIYIGSGMVWSVVTGKNITSIEQLKGKTSAVNAFGSSEHVFSQMFFKHYGIEDIKYISLGGSAERLAALQQGVIDTTFLVTPDDIRAEKLGLNVMTRVGDVIKSPTGGLGTQLDRIKNNPEQIKKFVRAALKGLLHLRANKEDAINILSAWVNLTPDEAKRAYELTVNGFFEGVASDEEILLDSELVDAGLTKANMDKVRDFTLVNEVRKELGLK